MAVLRVYPTTTLPRLSSILSLRNKFVVRNCNLQLQMEPNDSRKLVLEVKEKLQKEHHGLPVGRNGRDDEDMILWFLKDRKFSVEEAVSKLTKAIKWRQDFEVSELTEEAVKDVSQTGKAYVHDFLDINDRPVLVVVASKHFPQVNGCKLVFEAKTIQRMELLILSTLKWRIQAITPFSFIDSFLHKGNGDQVPIGASILQSVQLILSTIRGIEFLEFRQSEIAAAVAIYVVGGNSNSSQH